jgi:Tol biopolymer transport system component
MPSTWSPDSTRLVSIKEGNAWILPADGSEARQLTTFPLGGVTSATWSPDGRWIAVGQGTALWLVSPDGEERRIGVPEDASYREHVWSPDGSRLAVAASPAQDGYSPTGSMPVYIVDVEDGSATIIERAAGPVWSPDGRFIAVDDTANAESQDAIAVMNADGSGRHIVWSGEHGMGQTKAWLP